MTGSTAPRISDHLSIEAAIGAQVRRLRKKHDMTVMELAKQSGLSIGMLSKIENGTTSPSLTTLQVLAQALNVPITSFFIQFEERRDITVVEAGRGLTIERRGTKAGHRCTGKWSTGTAIRAISCGRATRFSSMPPRRTAPRNCAFCPCSFCRLSSIPGKDDAGRDRHAVVFLTRKKVSCRLTPCFVDDRVVGFP